MCFYSERPRYKNKKISKKTKNIKVPKLDIWFFHWKTMHFEACNSPGYRRSGSVFIGLSTAHDKAASMTGATTVAQKNENKKEEK